MLTANPAIQFQMPNSVGRGMVGFSSYAANQDENRSSWPTETKLRATHFANSSRNLKASLTLTITLRWTKQILVLPCKG